MYIFYTDQVEKIGGAEKYLIEIAKSLQKNQHQTILIYGRGKKIDHQLSSLFHKIYHNKEISKIKDLLKNQDINKVNVLVVIHYGYEKISEIFKGANVIIQYHNNLAKSPYYQSVSNILKSIDGTMYHNRIGLISNQYINKYNKQYPKQKPAILTPNGFKFEKYITKSEKRIIFVAWNRKVKQYPKAKAIFENFSAKHPDYKFDVFGGDYPKKDSNPAITYHGQVTNFNEIYGRAKLLIMTSSVEGFGRVIIEAASYGIPTVAYNSYDAAQEVILNGKTGELIKPNNDEDFINKMERIISNWDSYSQAASIHAQKYEITNITNNLVKEFSEISKLDKIREVKDFKKRQQKYKYSYNFVYENFWKMMRVIKRKCIG